MDLSTPVPTYAPLSAPAARSSVVRTLLPHLIWEAVLLVAVVVVAIVANAAHPQLLSRGGLWPAVAGVGLLTSGLALSLRTATPNLAVGTIAAASGWWYAKLLAGGWAPITAGLVAVLAALGIGLVLALVVGLTSAPAWAVTLAGLFTVQGALVLSSDRGVGIPVRTGSAGASAFTIWVVLFGLASVAGGVVFAIPAVRRTLGAHRSAEDPATWRPGKLVGALVGLVGSSALAGLAGVLTVSYTAFAQPTDNISLQFALAAALLGGVSVFGVRGGIFGTLLAVLLVELIRFWAAASGSSAGRIMLTVGVLALVGVGVSWLLDFLGRMLDRVPAGAP